MDYLQVQPSFDSLAEHVRGRHLRLIAAIGEEGTLTDAAAVVGVTQPTATKRLADLEHHLGISVYSRGPRGLTITEAGRELAAFATRFRSDLQRTFGNIQAMRGGHQGVVAIATIMGTSSEVLGAAIGQLRVDSPDLRVVVLGETSDTALRAVSRGDVEFGIGRFGGRSAAQGLVYEPLGDEDLVFCTRPGHPALEAAQTLADLAGLDWVLHPRDNPVRQALETEFLRSGLPIPEPAVEADSVTVMLRILEHSDAVALVSRSMVRDAVAAGSVEIVPVHTDISSSGFGICRRAERILSPGGRHLLSSIRAAARTG